MSWLAEFLLARIAEDRMACEAASDEAEWIGGRLVPLRPRLLAECEAKRRTIESCGFVTELQDEYAVGLRDDVLRALALPYSDHPDYDESWRP